MAEMSDEKKMDEIPVEDTAKVEPEQVDTKVNEVSAKEPDNVEVVQVEKTEASVSPKVEQPDSDDKSSQKDDRHDGRDNRRGNRYGARGEMSFEEKMRAFKKQSDERLHHIKRSREAKIGKKRTR